MASQPIDQHKLTCFSFLAEVRGSHISFRNSYYGMTIRQALYRFVKVSLDSCSRARSEDESFAATVERIPKNMQR